jgi:hypothetical protein
MINRHFPTTSSAHRLSQQPSPGKQFSSNLFVKYAPFLIILLLLVSTLGLVAGPKIYGSCKYQFLAENTSVTFGCDKISNPSKENATGTLIVRLWALDAPYQGGTLTGKILAEYKLDGLNPGAEYTKSAMKTLKASLPGRKATYSICLTVSEYRGGQYLIADYRNFDAKAVLGPPALFTMKGPWRWQASSEGGTVEMEVASITHTRSGSTGSLKLAVWATDAPYSGGALRGYLLGSVQKDGLKQGNFYGNVKNTAKYTRPPAGKYSMVIVLSEYTNGEYRIVSWLNSTGLHVFK